MALECDLRLVEPADWSGERILLLNSRQGKRPCRTDHWVEATLKAVSQLGHEGKTLITSVGLNTWELVLHAVNVDGGRQIVLLPPSENEPEEAAQVCLDFQLDRCRTAFKFLTAKRDKGAQSSKWWWRERDRVALEIATRAVPISLRPNSGLAAALVSARGKGILVDESFCVDYRSGDDRVSYELNPKQVNRVFRDGWDYLTHWTRSSHGPLPGEKSFDYYRDLCSSARYPRAAVDVLRRILIEQRLRASGRFLRAGVRAVAFTSQNPIDAAGLMRWRKRYVYYNFEPYGVAIHRDVGRELGIRPVIYGPPGRYQKLAAAEQPYFQNQGRAAADWLPEFELRHLGDIDLGPLPAAAIKVIIHRERDRELLPEDLPYEVIPLML